MRQPNFNFIDFKKAVRASADFRDADEPDLAFIDASTIVTLKTNLRTRVILNLHGQVTRLAQLLWSAEKINFASDRMERADIEISRLIITLGLMDIFSELDKPQFKRVQGMLRKSEPFHNIDVDDDSFHYTKDYDGRFHFTDHNSDSDKTRYLFYSALKAALPDLLPDSSTQNAFACNQFAHLNDLKVPATGYELNIDQVHDALTKCSIEHDFLLKAKQHYTEKQVKERTKGGKHKPGESLSETDKKLDTVNTILTGCELLTAQYMVLAQQLATNYALASEAGDATLPSSTKFTHTSMQRLQTAHTFSNWCDADYIRININSLRDIRDAIAHHRTLAEAGTGGASASAVETTTGDAPATRHSAAVIAQGGSLWVNPLDHHTGGADTGLLATATEVDMSPLLPSSSGGT
ncbi:MAG: hypothetical protein P1U34_00590 [Coxiellaceae bacterium]|nr:hypothetical protein [Coxiellaceae bacterium]